MMSALTSNLTVQDQHRRYNALKNYFTAGFSYKEICNFLCRFHRIKITIRHLNRLLRQCNLQRRGNHSNINTVIKFIQGELKGPSSYFGYRYMLQMLRSSGLTADKETARLILKSPAGSCWFWPKEEVETYTSWISFIWSKSYLAYW